MLTHLFRSLAALGLTLSLALPFAAGQGDLTIERGVKVEATESEKGSSGSPALPYFVIVVYSLLVLTIVYMPSRKA